MLLFDPRKLAAPVARLDTGAAAAAGRPGGGPGAAAAVAALHWQHTDAEIEARRAAPAATPLPAAEAAATPRIDLPLAPVRAGIALRADLPGACLRLSCRPTVRPGWPMLVTRHWQARARTTAMTEPRPSRCWRGRRGSRRPRRRAKAHCGYGG